MKGQSVKLFVDAHVFDGEYQGTRTFIREVYSIIATKPGIVLYLGANDIENLKKSFPEQPNIVFIKYRSASSITRLLFDIPSIIKKHRIQYAHFQYIVPVIKNCRFIDTVHDVIFSEYPDEFSLTYRVLKNWLFKTSARRSDILTTVSEYSKGSIQKHLGINTANTIVTPNGVAPRFFESYDKQVSVKYIREKYGIDRYVLFVSRLEPRKNHLLLLETWLNLKLYDRGYHLVLLGNRTIHVPGFDEAISHLPADIRSYIFLRHDVNDVDLMEFYRAASVFVYPSKAEGFGIPPLEAAALKIPVICSNTSAMSDFTFFGNTHINPYDPKIFEATLERTLFDPPDEAHLNEIREIIREKYSWGKSAERLYQAVIKDKNAFFGDSGKYDPSAGV